MSGIRPGDVIAGKFRVERVLGEGGMGYVLAARHLQLGQMVALKFMRDDVCTPEYRSRFLREARNTVRLKSKHVSRVLDVGTLDGGAPYMVMEYLEGTDLSDYLHKRGPIPVREACEYVIQACEAIAEAHGHGIVHRDLKPANLFLTSGAGGEPVVKVLDFGVSKVLDLEMGDDTSPGGRPRHRGVDSVVTKATDLLGSPSYMAPEQVVSARDADAQSDIWSLGVILFRLISGKAPFHGTSLGELIQQIMHGPTPNLREAKPDLPPGLEHVVARCLERDKSKRLADATELARLLAPYAGPVATPSLERIAILGPALLTSPSAPRPSAPSLTQSASASAWTSAPAVAAPEPERRDLSTVSAVVIGLLFAVVLGFGVLAAAAYSKRGAASVPPEPPPPSSAPVVAEPIPPAITIESAVPAPPPALVETVAPASPKHTRPRAGRSEPRGAPTAAPPTPTTSLPEDDIPTTRD